MNDYIEINSTNYDRITIFTSKILYITESGEFTVITVQQNAPTQLNIITNYTMAQLLQQIG